MKRKLNVMYLLILAVSVAQGVMWVNVFKLLHHGIWVYIGGIPAGVGIVGLVARGANLLPRVGSKRARNAGWVVLVLVMVVEPVVIGIGNWYAMPENIQSQWSSYVLAGGASLAIALALVLGALAERSLIPATKPEKAGSKPAKPATKPATPRYTCDYCPLDFGSQQALNAHQRKHRFKYNIDLSEVQDGRKIEK